MLYSSGSLWWESQQFSRFHTSKKSPLVSTTVSTSFGRCSLVPFYPKWLFLASLFIYKKSSWKLAFATGEEVLVCLSDWSSDCTCHAEWFGGYPVLLCGHGRPVVGVRGHGAHHLRHHHGGLFHPGIFCGLEDADLCMDWTCLNTG